MKATVRKLGKVSVLDISGKITIGEGDVLLREKVTELLDAGENRIVLNLEGEALGSF
jgi:anti-sigma B factor antagonist